ncbi:MAG: glutamate 5-kinase [bacterium]
MRERFKDLKRIVVKVGSHVLTLPDGSLNLKKIEDLASELCKIRETGIDIALVSSGAVAIGRNKLNICNSRFISIPQKQASASVGQCYLMWAYEQAFGTYSQRVAQILLTHEDFRSRKRYINIRNTIHFLFYYKVIPIINENDSVAVEEIKFGDNDNLSAMVANLVIADLLILLSDVDGLYSGDPNKTSSAKLIPFVQELTPEIEGLAGRNRSFILSTGGMASKIQAIKKTISLGMTAIIARGTIPQVVTKILNGEEVGTLFLPKNEGLSSRKHWILHILKSKGKITLDNGAKTALLCNNKSLLPSGIIKVEGGFNIGDAVSCCDEEGKEFAKGLTNYDAKELRQIKGNQSSKIEGILGYKHCDEVINRDDLVILLPTDKK